MYILEKGKELSATILTKILNKFNTQDRPKLQHLLDYYEGRQKILQKQAICYIENIKNFIQKKK